MAYTSNPHIGKARRRAVNDVLYHGSTKAAAARRYGVHRATIGKWIRRAPQNPLKHIETVSANPRYHPNIQISYLKKPQLVLFL